MRIALPARGWIALGNYEEKLVESYFITKGYLTAKNIIFSSPAVKKGGKGGGEIDVLAVKLSSGEIKEAIRCEVAYSTVATFPYIARGVKKQAQDETRRMIKKFFSIGAAHKINEYGIINPLNLYISSDFHPKVEEKLSNRLKEIGEHLININFDKVNRTIILELDHTPSDKKIELGGKKRIQIREFKSILRDLVQMMKVKGLATKHHLDEVLRGIQHIIKLEKT